MAQGNIAQANGIEIWHQTFGNKKDPAVLLIMGGLCQGILWPTEFCEQLAKAGFFVIRYDHRDAGFSTCFDFEKQPYDLLDMAKDAVGLLDFLHIQNAHLVGLSMGGPIAELAAVHYSDRVASLMLIATSTDFRPSSLSYDREYPHDIVLSKPKQIYLDWMHQFLESPPKNQEEQLEQRVKCWRILNGSIVPFEEQHYRELHAQFLSRVKHAESLLNHLSAIKKSFKMIQEVPTKVQVPTVILHGSEDPIFPPDHGVALSKAIPLAKYIPVFGMGHVPNIHFYHLIIKEIKENSINLANYLYKIISLDNWKASLNKKFLQLDANDSGFIHLAREDQLDRIIEKYWSKASKYVVIKLNTAKLPGKLVLETNPGGTNKYFHLYNGSIPTESVLDIKLIE